MPLKKSKKAKKFDTQQNIKSNIRNTIHINIGDKLVKKDKKDKKDKKAKVRAKTAPIPMPSYTRPQFAPIPINHSENVMSGLSNKIAMLDSRIASHLRNPHNVNLLNVPSRSNIERVSTADAYRVKEPIVEPTEEPIEEPIVEPNEEPTEEEVPPLNEPTEVHPQHSSNATTHSREDISNFNEFTQERQTEKSRLENKNDQYSDGLPRATYDPYMTEYVSTAHAIASSRLKKGRKAREPQNVASTEPNPPRINTLEQFGFKPKNVVDISSLFTPKHSQTIPITITKPFENKKPLMISNVPFNTTQISEPTLEVEPTLEPMLERIETPLKQPKKRGRKKGSKNKPKILK